MQKERVGYIDVAKGVGILLVILGHSMVGDIFLKNVIYSFHMPFFFILSGYFLNFERSIKSNMQKSFKMLLVPYFAVSLIQILLYGIFKRELLVSEFYTALMGGADVYGIHANFQNVIWFIPTLFLSRLICCLLYSSHIDCSNDVKNAIIILFAFLSVIETNHIGAYIPFYFSQSLLASLFLIVGYQLRKDGVLERKCLFATPLILCCCLAYSSKYLRMYMQTNIYPYAFIHVVCAIVISVSLLFIIKYACTKSEYNKVFKILINMLQWCGRYSLLILLIHFFDDKNILSFIDKSTIAENSAIIFIVRVVVTLPLAYLLLKVSVVRRILNYK